MNSPYLRVSTYMGGVVEIQTRPDLSCGGLCLQYHSSILMPWSSWSLWSSWSWLSWSILIPWSSVPRFGATCRLCFTWFQPIAGFWLLSLVLISGSHCVSSSIPLLTIPQPFNMKKLMAKVVWSVFWCHIIDIWCHPHYLCFWHFVLLTW